MERRKRSAREAPAQGADILAGMAGSTGPHGACVVCGMRDARGLVSVDLRGGEAATLCGSHALMHGRMVASCGSVAELRTALGERREASRRAVGEGDELAERLTAAFTRDRRGADRRAS